MKLSVRNITAVLFSAAISLILTPCLNAQVTINQQDRTARILSDGTIESGGGWISSVSRTNVGIYTVTFAKPFTQPPNCVVTADSLIGSINAIVGLVLSDSYNGPQPLDRIEVQTVSVTSGQPGWYAIDDPFRIHCYPDTNVGWSAGSWNAAGTITSGSDWIDTIIVQGTGTFDIVFKTPYVSTPNCVATAIANGKNAAVIQLFPTTTYVRVYMATWTGIVGPNPQNIPGTIMCSGPQ